MMFEPIVHSTQTMHLSCIKINTISKRTETTFHLSLVTKWYHRVRPKRFLSLWYVWRKPCIYLAPTLTLSPSRPKQDSTWPLSPRSSIGCVKNVFQAYGMFSATMHLGCVKIRTTSKRTKMSFHLSLVTKEYHRVHPKWFSEPMVHLAQAMHLSCTNTNSVSKRTRMTFHKTHIT